MRKSKVCFIVLTSLLAAVLVLPLTSYGCWFPISELEPAFQGTDAISFMEFGIYKDSLLRPWHYYPISPGNESWDQAGENTPLPPQYSANTQEWRSYCRNQPTTEDVVQLIYDSKNLAQLQSSYRALVASQPVPQRQQPKNSMLQWLLAQKDTAALAYIIYAKKCEPVVTVASEWSDYHVNRQDGALNASLLKEGLAGYQRAASPFLKIRYAYQLVRLYHYLGSYDECISYYDKLVPVVNTDSQLKYWALLHKAGALKRNGANAQALVLTSLVFDQCPALMEKAFLDFKIPDEQLWRQSYGSLKSNHQKATFWLLRGLREKRIILEPLQQLYQLEPGSSRLEMMLVRQVNRLEELALHTGFFFPQSLSRSSSPKEEYRKYLTELKKFVLAAVETGKVRQPALWYLTAGYLSFLEQDPDTAEQFLKTAEARLAQNEALRHQIALVKNLCLIAKAPTLSPQLEQRILPSLTWAASLNQRYHNQTVFRSLLILLGQKYLLQQQVGKAALCFSKAGYYFSAGALLDFYATSADLDQLLALYPVGRNTLEKFLLTANGHFDSEQLPVYTKDALFYTKGTKLMRQAKFQEAYQAYAQISEGFWKQAKKNTPDLGVITAFNPDYWNTQDQIVDALSPNQPTAPQRKQYYYSKLEFVRKVLELEANAAKNPGQAGSYYLQLANGFFHSPYWGYNDIIWNGALVKSIRDTDYWQYPFNLGNLPETLQQKLDAFLTEYGTRQIAIRYYYQAAQATPNRELAAQSLWLACEAEQAFSPLNHEREEYPGEYRLKLQQDFGILQKQYLNTQFIQKTIQECTSFKDFLGRN